MHPLIEKLVASGPVLTDGAWGTQMQALGLPVGSSPDGWNLTQPDRVEVVAKAYVDAGSQIILTNTFGASRITLDRHGLADQAAAINTLFEAVQARLSSRSGRDPERLVRRGLRWPEVFG